MRRVIVTVVGTVIALVLLLSFKTHPLTSSSAATPPAVVTPSASAQASVQPSATAASGNPSAAPSSAAPTSAPTTTKTKAPTKSKTSTATRTVEGDPVDTRYGPVQVKVTLSGSTITDVVAVQVPSDQPRDVEINDFAVPVLRQEVLKAQSAQIDMVSGATYTSQGYLQSLQSALDKAKAS